MRPTTPLLPPCCAAVLPLRFSPIHGAWRRLPLPVFLQMLLLMWVLQACGGSSVAEPTPTTPPPVQPPVEPPVQPPPAATAFTLLPARVELLVGGQGAMRTLQATAAVNWASSNAAVAAVDSTGLVTAKAAGSALISATVGTQSKTAAVTVHTGTAATSTTLIEQALALNRISAEQALIYRVFASFGDTRLPAEFQGAPQTAPGHLLMREVSGRLPSLSQAAQDTLLPFLVPPIYAESWHAQQLGQAAATGQAGGVAARKGALSATLRAGVGNAASARTRPLLVNVNCAQAALPAIWSRRTTAHFNIYYLSPGAQGDQRAQNVSEAVAAVVEEVYTSLTGVLQRFPISDANLACNGGDGAYDIYVLGWAQGGTVAEVTTYPGACKNAASYMSVNSLHHYLGRAAALPGDTEGRRKVKSMVTHEFMHALQFTLARSAACDEYTWIDEATAQWATDHVDPGYDQEDGFDKQTSAATRTGGHLLRYLSNDHMESMEKPGRNQSAADRGYAGYLFFQYLARRYTADTLRQILDAQTSHASVEAVAAALALHGGMKAVWPEFAQTLWLGRSEQVLDYWSRTDRYDYGLVNLFNPAPGDTFAQGQTRLRSLKLEQAGRPRATFKLLENAHNFVNKTYEVDPRSLYVEHLKFSDENVRAVLFVNPIALLPNRDFMKLQAVKKVGGAWQPVEDWTAEPTKNFCRDKRDERLEELILIVSNSEVNRSAESPFRIPEIFPMRVSTSNVGCWRWVGTASTTTTYDDGAGPLTGLSGQINGSGVVRWEVSAQLPGSIQFEPRAGFIDGGASGRLSGCTFTDVASRRVLDASGLPGGYLHINLDLDLGFGEPPNRELTAFNGGAGTLQSTRTLVCPGITVTSSGPASFDWLAVNAEATYAISADGQTLEGEYIANLPIPGSTITTRFRFAAERE